MSQDGEKAKTRQVLAFEKNSLAFLESKASGVKDDVWTKVKVLAQSGTLVTVRAENSLGNVLQVDLSRDKMLPCNESVEADLTSLRYMHEAAILENLQCRSYENEPYTFMGNVLVAVNPLKFGPEPPNSLGQRHAAAVVHPFAVAENAYQQMCFRGNQMRRDPEEKIAQSVCMSGESGAGKTESAKLVLRHLMVRAGSDENNDLTARLLMSSELLEAFGNSGTLRNHNSSRFGKFTRLWFKKEESPVGQLPQFTISNATIQTYLLEQSRITLHGLGEYNFHIFYYLLQSDMVDDLRLDMSSVWKGSNDHGETGFRYLDPHHVGVKVKQNQKNIQRSSVIKQKRNTMIKFAQKDTSEDQTKHVAYSVARSKDSAKLEQVLMSFDHFNVGGEEIKGLTQVLAGILHLGNVNFKDEFLNNQTSSTIDDSAFNSQYSPLEVCSELLQCDKNDIVTLLTTRKVTVMRETSIINLDSGAAAIARDSLSRVIYTGLFNWVVHRLNHELNGDSSHLALDDDATPFIGILDIFGFEVFEKNSFEQLLINYANEALQGTFDRSIFISELDLYKREGLFDGDDDGSNLKAPDNSQCLELFEGKGNGAKIGMKMSQEIGLLKLIDSATEALKGSDEKMNANFHRVYEKNPCFSRLHPIDRRDKFVVVHYAGVVTYTVGSFIQKNRDGLPKETIDVMAKSGNLVLRAIMEELDHKASKHSHGRHPTISHVFGIQMKSLISTLESTSTSFIRCIKPNASLMRGKADTWFNRKYVSAQLKNLSIPQTVAVLSTGYPTRIPYKRLVEQYKNVLPSDALDIWKKSDSSVKAFIEALFYAFGIERNKFKMGYSKVFFRSGELESLDHILNASRSWKSGSSEQEEVAKRFKYYYIRKKWRIAYAKVFARNRFVKLCVMVHERAEARRREQERLERLRKEKLRKRWRINIIAVRFLLAKKKEIVQRYEEIVKEREEAARLKAEAEEKERLEKEERERIEKEKKDKERAQMEENERIALEEKEEAERLEKEKKEKEEKERKEKEDQARKEEEEKAKEEEESRRRAMELEEAKKLGIIRNTVINGAKTQYSVFSDEGEAPVKSTAALLEEILNSPPDVEEDEMKEVIREPEEDAKTHLSVVTESTGKLKSEADFDIGLNQLDPFRRLRSIVYDKIEENLSEEEIMRLARENVLEMHKKQREEVEEKLQNVPEEYRKYLEGFYEAQGKARELDDAEMERLVRIEAEKLRLKNAHNHVKNEEHLNEMMKSRVTAQDLMSRGFGYPEPDADAMSRMSKMGSFAPKDSEQNDEPAEYVPTDPAFFYWEKHWTDDEEPKMYYFNPVTGQSQWPPLVADFEEKQKVMRHSTKDKRRRNLVKQAADLAREHVEEDEPDMEEDEKHLKAARRFHVILNDLAQLQIEAEDHNHVGEGKKKSHKDRSGLSKLYKNARAMAWFRHSEDKAERKIIDKKKKNQKKMNKSNNPAFHELEERKTIRRGGVIQEVVNVSDEHKTDAALNQFRQLEDLAAEGEFTPEELLQTKKAIAENLDGSSRGSVDSSDQEANVAIVCTTCHTINHSHYGDICTYCHNPLPYHDGVAMKHRMNGEASPEEKFVEQTYWDSIDWDLTATTSSGEIRLLLENIETVHDIFGQSMTQFSTSVLHQVKHKSDTKWISWRVNHWYHEWKDFTHEAKSGKTGKILGKKSRKAIQALDGAYLERVPVSQQENTMKSIKDFLHSLDQLFKNSEKEKKQKKFFSSVAVDDFFEIRAHDEADLAQML